VISGAWSISWLYQPLFSGAFAGEYHQRQMRAHGGGKRGDQLRDAGAARDARHADVLVLARIRHRGASAQCSCRT
jgi:hypothetical protein